MKKLAVNIGINHVDNSSYGVQIPELLVAENDAVQFNQICIDNDFQSQLILSEEATTSNILKTLKSASKTLNDGDIFFLSYSGHGCKFPDLNGDEEDGLDEAWVCFDKPLLDDEIKFSLSQFSEGVKCFIILDCCYANGTTDAKKSRGRVFHPSSFSDELIQEFTQNKRKFSALKRKAKSLSQKKEELNAGIIIMSACDENELAYANDNHGVFTQQILNLIQQNKSPKKPKKGKKYNRLTPNYLIEESKKKLSKIQTPQLSKLGNVNRSMLMSSLF